MQHLVLGTVATRSWRAELRPIAVGMVVHQVTVHITMCLLILIGKPGSALNFDVCLTILCTQVTYSRFGDGG